MNPQPRSNRVTVALVLGLMAAALCVRLSIVARTEMLSKDCYHYVELANLAATGDVAGTVGLCPFIPPLMVALMALLVRLGLSGEAAGVLISVASAVALAPLVYLLARRLFSERAALFAGIAFVAHPLLARYSVQILRGNLFLCLFLWAVWLAFRALEEGGVWRWALSGLLCGLAVCTRKEGWELPIALCLYLGLLALRKRYDEVRRNLVGVAALLAVMALTFTPFGILMSRHGAVWQPVDVFSLAHYLSAGWWRDSERVKEVQWQ